jgi:glycosyltransferase involved in cell wall biosynthesis
MITERFPPDMGGVARSAERIAQALGGMGVEVHVLAWTRSLPGGVLETVRGDSPGAPIVHRLGLYANLDMSLQHTINVLEWLHGAKNFGAIWGHYLHPSGFLAVLAARGFKRPSVVAARGNDVDRLMFPPGDFARLTWTLQHADIVTAVSRDLAHKVSLLVDRPAGVEVITNVVDPEIFAPGRPDQELRSGLGIAAEEIVLGFCGELRHKKGLPFLLGALREVRQRRAACLLVIGEMRAREATVLSTFSAEAPVDASRIIVTGPFEAQSEVARHLRLCDVALCPSVWDGLPNALLEAMSCARPVIASAAGGIPEVIEHNVSGLLIPKAELHRLGEAILELLDEGPDAADALGSAARRRTLAAFHPEIERNALSRVVDRLFPGGLLPISWSSDNENHGCV